VNAATGAGSSDRQRRRQTASRFVSRLADDELGPFCAACPTRTGERARAGSISSAKMLRNIPPPPHGDRPTVRPTSRPVGRQGPARDRAARSARVDPATGRVRHRVTTRPLSAPTRRSNGLRAAGTIPRTEFSRSAADAAGDCGNLYVQPAGARDYFAVYERSPEGRRSATSTRAIPASDLTSSGTYARRCWVSSQYLRHPTRP